MEFHGPRDQILEQASAENQTTVVYTVPAGKKFYLISSVLTTDGGAVGSVKVCIRNDSDVVQVDINKIKVGVTALVFPACPYFPNWPPELAEGWDIAVISDIASLVGEANIFGYEVNA